MRDNTCFGTHHGTLVGSLVTGTHHGTLVRSLVTGTHHGTLVKSLVTMSRVDHHGETALDKLMQLKSRERVWRGKMKANGPGRYKLGQRRNSWR